MSEKTCKGNSLGQFVDLCRVNNVRIQPVKVVNNETVMVFTHSPGLKEDRVNQLVAEIKSFGDKCGGMPVLVVPSDLAVVDLSSVRSAIDEIERQVHAENS